MRKLSLGFAAVVVLLWIAEAFLLHGTWFGMLLIWVPHQFLLLPATALLVATVIRQERWEGAVAGFAALVVVFAFCSFTAPVRRARPGARLTPLTVVTYNIEGGLGGFEALRKTLEESEADLVLLQDFPPVLPLSPLLPHGPQGWHVGKAGEMAILSRHPIREWHDVSVQVSGSGRSCLEASLDVQGTTVHVVDFHHSLLFPGEHVFPEGFTIPEYMRQRQQLRRGETEALLRIGREAGAPLIVGGDFSAPPRDADVARLMDTWSDAFSRGGIGFGHTYYSSFPLVRTDYILTTPDLGVTSCESLSSTASDHLPVRARLLVPASR